ncbi:MAG: IS110 family transposase [Chitinophagaceae bacterium]
MSKLLKNFVGIDISKAFFDVAIFKTYQSDQIAHQQFKQSPKGFDEMNVWLAQQDVLLDEETLFCMEYTGIYNTALVDYLVSKSALLWVEMAIKIKKSEGFERSSNDKTDAVKIARYAYRFQDRKQLWKPVDSRLNKIKHLIAQRDRIVDTICRLTVPVNELKEIGCIEQARDMAKLQKAVIRDLEKIQKNIETAIVKIIKQDEELSHKVERVKSIIGIGQVTAVAYLVYTKGFTSFENGKQLSCYSGVVPFIKKQSGSSVKSKARVSQFANKKLKWLLHLCATSAIQYDQELKAYYERKVLEGKNKLSVINAVRNKLVLRIFAVLRDDRDFVKNYVRKCA